MSARKFFTAVSLSNAYMGFFSNTICAVSPRLSPEMTIAFANMLGINGLTYYEDDAGLSGHLIALALHSTTALMLCDDGYSPQCSMLLTTFIISGAFGLLSVLSGYEEEAIREQHQRQRRGF